MKNTIKSTIVNFIEQSGHNRFAKRMLLLSDRQLDDIGLSRGKLESGAKAYPWKVETNAEFIPNIAQFNSTKRIALQAQNDSNTLADQDRPRAA